MYSQDDSDYFLFPFHSVGLFQGPPELRVTTLASGPEAGLRPISEQAGRYLDGITVDPLGGILVTSSDSDIPPIQVPTELPQGFCVPQILPDKQAAGLSPHDMAAVNHVTVVDIGVEPNVVAENRTPVERPATRRPRNLAKRRTLRSRKSGRIDEIRTLMGMEPRTPKVEILCAAIQRLGGNVPQSVYESNTNRIKLAYEALHKSTGSQGRLRHVQCLELVIKALKGLPTLDPVFVGQPNGSTR